MSTLHVSFDLSQRRTKSALDTAVQARISLEKKIVRSLVNELIDGGFVLSLDNGGDSLEIENCADAVRFLKETQATDEETIFARKGDVSTWASLVYGNDGYDVISDSGVSLDALTPVTQALIERLSA